jgi:hypothetical protein
MPTQATIIAFLKRFRWFIAAAVIVVIGGFAADHYFNHTAANITTDVSTFSSGNFSFTYPRVLAAKEYDDGVVSLGGESNGVFIPFVDVVRYKSDPDRAAPASFETFVARQAVALCGGSDAAGADLACADPVVKPYASPTGLAGSEVSLTLIHTDPTTGARTESTYAPVYVFNTTPDVEPGEALRYQAVFVYPDFSTFALASSSASLVPDIAAALEVTTGKRFTTGSTTPAQQ